MAGLRFFFYGTLLAGSGNPVAFRIHRKLRLIGPGHVRGRLFAIPDPEGWYPALIAGRGGRVQGAVYEATGRFTAHDLALLDGYERHVPPGQPLREYLRAEIAVRLADGRLTAQAYLYRLLPPAAALPIPDGDFAGLLRRAGWCGFGASGASSLAFRAASHYAPALHRHGFDDRPGHQGLPRLV